MREIRVAVMMISEWVQKGAWPGMGQKFVNLAASVAEIEICCIGIGHIGRCRASQIDVNMGMAGVAAGQSPRQTDPKSVDGKNEPSLKEHDVRRENQVVPILIAKPVEQRAPPFVPGG